MITTFKLTLLAHECTHLSSLHRPLVVIDVLCNWLPLVAHWWHRIIKACLVSYWFSRIQYVSSVNKVKRTFHTCLLLSVCLFSIVHKLRSSENFLRSLWLCCIQIYWLYITWCTNKDRLFSSRSSSNYCRGLSFSLARSFSITGNIVTCASHKCATKSERP